MALSSKNMTEFNTIAKLSEAINNKNIVRINYKHDASRIIAPAAIYINQSTNNTLLDAFQYEGFTNTTAPAWKRFAIEDIKTIEITSNNFKELDGFNPFSVRYRNAISKIIS